MPCCDTGRNIQKYKGAAASTLQDVTDNGNTTTGDIITTSGFFIGDGSLLTGIAGASSAFSFQDTSDRGNTTSNTIQFTNTITSLTTSGNVIVTGNVTASKFYGDGTTLTGVALSTDLASNSTRIGTVSTDLADNSTRISTVSTDLASNSTRIGTVSTDLASNVLRIGTLESEVQPVNRGGTNITSYGIGDMLYASASSTLSKLTPSTTGYFLRTNGTGNAPTWENVADIGSSTPANLYTDDYITGGPWSGLTDANIRVLGNVSNLSNQLVARDDKGDIFVSNVNAIKIYGDGTSLTGVALGTDLTDNSTRINTVSTDLADNSTRINTVSTDLADNSTRISTVSTDLADNSTRISTVSTDLADNSTRISTVSTDLADNSTRINTVSTDLADNSTRINTVSTDLASNSTRITNLQNSTIISNSSGITDAFETGDLIYASGQNTLSNLSIGSTNDVLTVSGGIPTWVTPSGGGGGGGYWTQNGSIIYYNSGNVGINTSTPQYKLDVTGDIRTTSENGFRGNGHNITGINVTSERGNTIINFGQQSSHIQSANGDPE